MDGGSGDAVIPCDLAQAVSMLTVSTDGCAIEFEGWRPMCRPSSRARRMPARTRSTIRLRSSSAMAPMITTMARPSGPPVSICSRKLTNSMPSRFSSSSTSRKCLSTGRSDRKPRPGPHRSGRGGHPASCSSSPGRRALAPLIRSVYSCDDLVAALSGHLAQVVELGLRMLIDR